MTRAIESERELCRFTVICAY